MNKVMPWYIDLFNHLGFPIRMQPMLFNVFLTIHYGIVYWWIAPLALRLDLRRGAWWLFIMIATDAVLSDLLPRDLNLLIPATLKLLRLAALALVLRGWRSRVWMLFPGGALYSLVAAVLWSLSMRPPEWIGNYVALLPYAATLLYGTRLLTPEEKVRT
jgi:hypothetical protein